MLSDQLKKTIRQVHQHVASNLTDYRPRSSQNYLVAEIAKTLAGEYHKKQRICVIEAGTGTGKSLAYCLGAFPLALAQKKEAGYFYCNRGPSRAINSKRAAFF